MATSASVHTNSWDGRTITLLVEETATSIENNTSTVKWTLTSGTSSTYHNVYEITAWVNGTADANKVYGPKTATWDTRAFPCKDGSTSGTITITHNADGTASPVPFRLRGSVRNNNPQNYDGSITLTTIPRTSSFTISKTSGGAAATSWNLGEALYVNITRASSSFTHKVYFVVGSSGNQVISNSAGTSANTTLASSLAQYIPSSSATATIYVDTYSGSTKIGSATKTFTINVPSNVLPSISSVTKTDTAGYLSTYNAYVQGKSNLRVQTSASGNYSSITNYTVQLKNSGGTILNTKTGSDITFSNISYTGTITVLVTVTDSRNRQATNTSTITVATYENPKITTFNAERRNNDATVTITYNASITNINSRNVNGKTFRIYKRQKGTSSWGNAIATYTSGYTYNGNTTTSCDENYGWEFKLEAVDSFTTTTKTDEVGTAFELVNWKADGTAMAIGKVSEKSNTFEIDLMTEFNSSLYVKDTTGRIDNSKYITSDFTNTFKDTLLGNNLTMIKKSGTWDSTYFPNYSCGIAWIKDNQGGFLIPSQSSSDVYVGGVSNGIVQWHDRLLMDDDTTIHSWTPTIACLSETAPTVSYSNRSGYYCQVGSIVFFDFYIRAKITALNGTNNYALISGLPKTATNHGFGAKTANIGALYSAVATTTNNVFLIDGTTIRIQANYGAGAVKWIVTPTSYMEVAGSGWYFVS